MSLESLLSLLIGIPIGIVSGLYTGVIVSRYVRFAELRTDVLRSIRSIDFIGEESFVTVTNTEDLPKLQLVASDLLSLGHRMAGERLLGLAREIGEVNQMARSGRIIAEEYNALFGGWQEHARSLPPNKLVLWSLWGRL